MNRLGRPALAAATLALVLGPAAGIALAGVPATNANGTFVDLDVSAGALASTPKVSVGFPLVFNTFTGNRAGNAPSISSSIRVTFPAGSKFTQSVLKQCTLNPDPSGFSACASNSQFGKGTAEGAVYNATDKTTTFVSTDLAGYNGSPVDGKPSLIFLATKDGKTVSELDFTVANGAGGPVLEQYHVPGSAPAVISIAQFNLSVPDLFTKKGKGKTAKLTHFLSAPKTCPKTGWKFTQTDTYDFGTLTASAFSPCVKVK